MAPTILALTSEGCSRLPRLEPSLPRTATC